MLKKILVTLALLVLAVSAQAQVIFIPEGTKLNINNFDVDLTETVSTNFYLNQEGFKSVIYNSLRRRLQTAGVFSEVHAPDDINLDIYIDYLRRFPGDATPFPSSSLAAPNFYMDIKLSNEKEVFFQQKGSELTIQGGSLFGAATDADVVHDIEFMIGLTNTVMREISTVYATAKIDPLATVEEKQALALDYYARWKKNSAVVDTGYIPESVADDYIHRLQSPDFKARLVAYQDIDRDWLNSKKLFDFIRGEIARKYKLEDDSDNTKEVREAMNALASSGLPEYSDFFKEIKANASNKKIVSEVDDSEKILSRRAIQGAVIHDASNVNPQESWKVNQLARIALFAEPKIREQGAKVIYLNYLNNTYLQDTLADILEKEAFKGNYKAGRNASFHNWICRILGDSKNKKYIALLERAKNEASTEGVRKYATKYVKILSNS